MAKQTRQGQQAPWLGQALQGLGAVAPAIDDPHHVALGPNTQVYCVGGAVRDVFLGHLRGTAAAPDGHDRDYLVVGSSPEAMAKAGFRPVGRDFPVFLHPTTHAEYALARTERKSGRGYHGFVFHAGPDVSLEEDLQRRDLTINAMAVDAQGALHDPLGGLADLESKTLRHVSAAFNEDPVRLLRLARFAARWPDFQVAPETEAHCRHMVAEGEVNALVGERVWQEIARGLAASQPSRMVALLVRLGAWGPATKGLSPPSASILAEVDALAAQGDGALQQPPGDVALRAGLLFSETPAPLALAGLPKDVIDWHRLLQPPRRRAMQPSGQGRWSSTELLSWMTEADAFRRPERLLALAQLHQPPLPASLGAALATLAARPMGDVAKAAAANGQPVPEAIRASRLALLDQLLDEFPN